MIIVVQWLHQTKNQFLAFTEDYLVNLASQMTKVFENIVVKVQNACN